jgi:uncharacterized membrane protein
MLRTLILIFQICLFLFPLQSFAQAKLEQDVDVIEKAVVLDVLKTSTSTIPDSNSQTPTQTIKVQVLDGQDKDTITTFDNDYVLVEKGETVYVRHQVGKLDSIDMWSVSDPYRLDVLVVLFVVFVVLLFVFGGIQGIRGLLSLCGSLVLIFYVLLPGILSGYSPILVSIGVASLVISVGSYITHGFNRATTAAVVGMIVTVLITGFGAYYIVSVAKLTGYVGEESVYLNLDTRGSINMIGLLFGGIMIGLLGVLYDIAIGQAVAVEELCSAGLHLSRVQIYKKAIRIGREHIGALVNTLAITYVGVSLPLLLLIAHSSTLGLPPILNSEVFATEAVRILIGSIGLILAVPITTCIASYILHGKKGGGEAQGHSHHHH